MERYDYDAYGNPKEEKSGEKKTGRATAVILIKTHTAMQENTGMKKRDTSICGRDIMMPNWDGS